MFWSSTIFLGSLVGFFLWYAYKTLYMRLVTDYLKHTATEILYKNVVEVATSKIVDMQFIHNGLMNMNVGDAIFTFTKLIRDFASKQNKGRKVSSSNKEQ
jgi:hypothetical protein